MGRKSVALHQNQEGMVNISDVKKQLKNARLIRMRRTEASINAQLSRDLENTAVEKGEKKNTKTKAMSSEEDDVSNPMRSTIAGSDTKKEKKTMKNVFSIGRESKEI
jgi:hypothetical protein